MYFNLNTFLFTVLNNGSIVWILSGARGTNFITFSKLKAFYCIYTHNANYGDVELYSMKGYLWYGEFYGMSECNLDRFLDRFWMRDTYRHKLLFNIIFYN